jgi:hypothetical protein
MQGSEQLAFAIFKSGWSFGRRGVGHPQNSLARARVVVSCAKALDGMAASWRGRWSRAAPSTIPGGAGGVPPKPVRPRARKRARKIFRVF